MGMVGAKKAMGFEAEALGGEELTWEKLLARAPVSVLLVERDESTSQIIAVLLRKCGYRVTVASDGMKAWAILRENNHNIDLVLTEVDLPKMSGVALLTMIMTHESCKHIPVIMMSSNDSVSIAFKCMIKGAADFLVKPIRRNELTNLWQHVWRRQKGEIYAIQKKNLDFDYDYRSNENAEQDDKDCNEKESDTQSSCTRLDMEVESTCTLQNKIELRQAHQNNCSLFDEATKPDNCFEKQLNGMSLFPNADANGFISSGCDIQPEVFDPIVITYQLQRISSSENSNGKSRDTLLTDINMKKKTNSIPSLQLSLERCPHIIPKRKGNDESNALNHSNSSAFSLYNKRSKVDPALSKQANFQAQNKESSGRYTEPAPPIQFAAKPLHYDHESVSKSEDANLMDAAALSRQEGTAFRCTPIRFIPFPVPSGGISFDASGSNPFLQSAFYPQSDPSMWSAMQEDFTKNLSCQSGVINDFKSAQSHHPEDHSLKSQTFQGHYPGQVEEAELVDATGDSSSECNDNRIHPSKSGMTDICNEGNSRPVTTAFDISEASARPGDEEGFQMLGLNKSVDAYRSSQREAALTKFRLKRKERCFEKKVRYLSRQKLAEQRPRVKGQFVRQV